MLTGDEREAVDMAAQLYCKIEQIISHGANRDGDLAEMRAAIHVIQRGIMSQAAARAYPGEFRLLGADAVKLPGSFGRMDNTLASEARERRFDSCKEHEDSQRQEHPERESSP